MDSPLESMLIDLGSDVLFPDAPPVVDDVLARLARPSPLWAPRRRLRVAIVAAVVIITTLIALPGPRKAIADLFGLGGVTITTGIELPPVPIASDFAGDEVTLPAARAAADFTVVVASEYGDPAAVFLQDHVPGGLVTLAYEPGDNSYGLVITEMLGTLDRPLLEKVAGPDTTITPVEVAGHNGYWIQGAPHLLLVLDQNGRDRVDRPRLVGNTLLYERGDLTIRIESALDLAEALAIADTLSEPSQQ